ncbi:hypothetical protein BT96DRAFT_980660 [Gymnopus androsaceus JB14]|uniref:G-protein coupled receptors family 1 profile domain-containing protein n=1 Tax=Gymnopus androsaceus JB14 TaxID=1447944 RepID=A0A6A4GV24_9AGAR|nr:hypothetical protein BT96DRAFT_980660 [Gymnopus androsaceus JB14]
MTPEESEQIAILGTVFFQNSSSLIFLIGLFGVYMLVFIISMHIILQKENNGWAHKALITLLLAGFVMVVLSTCSNVVANLLLVKFGLVLSLSRSLTAQEMAANLKAIIPGMLSDWSGSFIFLIADTAIVWRAWALWAKNRPIKLILLIILLADIGISFADSVVDTKEVINLINNTVTLDLLSTALNVTVNIVATLLIAYRAWTHHQSTRVILRSKKTEVEAILLLMVESGAIFGVVQLSFIIIQALDLRAAPISPTANAIFFLNTLYVYSAALNPVALVILVQTGNTYERSSHLEDAPSHQIHSVLNVS